MKLFFFAILIGVMTFFFGCNKSNNKSNKSARLNAMQGIWSIKSSRCYQTPNITFAYPPDAYYKFNSDLTGFIYAGSPTNQYYNFTYNLLSGDSTLVMPSTSFSGIPDTMLIVSLTSNQFIFHGINTYVHGNGLTPCLNNGNVIDSLYR
jgi:hypothetical protein